MKQINTTNNYKYFSKIYFFLVFILPLFSSTQLQAQIAGWDMSGLSNYGPSPYTASTYDLNVTVGGLKRGSGVTTTGTASGNAWGGNGLEATNFSNAIAANDFAYFTVKANSGNTISLESISRYRIQRSATGPTTGQWQYSLNGTTFTNIGTSINWGTIADTAGTLQSAIDLVWIHDLQNVPSSITVTLRVVTWGASDAGGTWYINNFASGDDLKLIGTVAGALPCTPPTTWPSGFGVSSITASSMDVTWDSIGSGDNVLVVARAGSFVDAEPVSGETYYADASFGYGSELGSGNFVVYNGAGSNVNVTNLQPGLEYFYSIYTYNSVDNCYFNIPLTGAAFTSCVTATNISDLTTNCGNTNAAPSWSHATCYDEYMVVAKLHTSISGVPSGDGSGYDANLVYGSGDAFDGGFIVYKGSLDSINGVVSNLINDQIYYFRVFTRLGTVWSNGIELNCAPAVNSNCLYEEFNAANMPAGWLASSIDFNVFPGAASFNQQKGELTTFSISNPQQLSFYLSRTDDLAWKTLYVEVSRTSQTTGFSTIATYDHSNTTSNGITPIVIDLLSFNSFSTIYIRFRKVSETSSPWRIDNVEVVCLAALPVTLLTFQTNTYKNNQLLTWTYESPEFFDYFEVEHSRDGKNFIALGKISEGELVSRAYSSNYTHILPGTGIHYYRLRLVDLDRSFAYSNVIQGIIEGSGSAVRPLSTFISSEGLNVSVEKTINSLELRLVDQLGRTVYHSTQAAEAGILNITLSNLNAGLYFLQVNADGIQETFKMVR